MPPPRSRIFGDDTPQRSRSASPQAPYQATRRRSERVRERQDSEKAEQLPRELSFLSHDTDRSAGQQIADLEAAQLRLEGYTASGRKHDEIVIKSLKAFLDNLPPEGRQNVVNDINRTNNDQEIYDVFYNLFTGLTTRMLSRSTLPSVALSPDLRRVGNAAALTDDMDQPQKRQEKFRDALLRRDDNRCVVTGDMDDGYYNKIGSPEDIEYGLTQGVHIIPFSYATWDTTRSDEKESIGASWEVLFRCFPAIEQMRFKHENINDLKNGIILRDWVHAHFGRFHLAFRPTKRENVYNVEIFKGISSNYKRLIKQQVEFKKNDSGKEWELPSRELLECHWRLSKILYASGMAEAFSRDHKEWDSLKQQSHRGLKEDGTTDMGAILLANPYLWTYVTG